MNILITGSSGFIGKNLKDSFSKKYTLFTPTHNQLNLLDESAVLSFFQKNSIDLVIHCAFIGGSRIDNNKKETFYDNMRMFLNVVRCKKYFKRMINIGSGAAYDKRYPIVKVKEGALGERVPDDGYGLFKYLCSAYIRETKDIVDLRVFGLFGEWEEYQYRFISNAICRLIFGMPILIRKNVVFDYLDVKDFMKIVDYFIHNEPRHTAYNIGSGNSYNLIQLAERIKKLDVLSKDIIINDKKLNNEYTCDTSLLHAEIPKLRFTPMDESIQRLYKWYIARKKDIKSEIL